MTCYCEAYYNFVCPECRQDVEASKRYYRWVRRYPKGMVEAIWFRL